MPGARFARLVFCLSMGIRTRFTSDRFLRSMDSMEAIVPPHHFHTPVDLTPMIGESANPPPVAKTNVENTWEFSLNHYFDTEDFNRRLHSLEDPASKKSSVSCLRSQIAATHVNVCHKIASLNTRQTLREAGDVYWCSWTAWRQLVITEVPGAAGQRSTFTSH